MSGLVSGAAMIVASVGRPEAGGPDSGTGDTGGVAFAGGLGTVGGACTGGCGGTTGASSTASAGVAGAACGVAGNDVSALVSASAVLMRCHRLGSVAAGSVVPASGDMTSRMYWANVEITRSRVLGSQSLTRVLRTAQALGLSWGYASRVKGAARRLRRAGRR